MLSFRSMKILKYIFIFVIIVSGYLKVEGRPVQQQETPKIIKYEFDNPGNGSYRFYYETSDGVSREENGQTVKKSTGEEILVVRGAFAYTGDDGQKYEVRYIADENGFRPEGKHLKIGFKHPLEQVPENEVPEVVIDNRIDPKLIGTLLGGGLG